MFRTFLSSMLQKSRFYFIPSLGRTLKDFAQLIGPHYSGMTQFYRAMGARVLNFALQVELILKNSVCSDSARVFFNFATDAISMLYSFSLIGTLVCDTSLLPMFGFHELNTIWMT